MYHDVVPRSDPDRSGFAGPDAARYKLDPDDFDDHLTQLSRVLPRRAQTVLDAARAPGDRPAFLLTFDDGGVSAYTDIAARLEARGYRGHFFVVTDHIGHPAFLSADQIRDLHRRGHVVGSHSASHPLRMGACTQAQLLEEWRKSTRALAEILGEPARVASLPGGHYTRAVAETAARAGIRHLFTSEPVSRATDVAGCQVIGRYTILRWTPAAEAVALAQGRAAPCLRQYLMWNAKKLTKAVAGPTYLRLRQRWLGGRLDGRAEPREDLPPARQDVA
jgi:peptidoglycan/xylan/chitin deacetylase (PgdA/CDA1 family)